MAALIMLQHTSLPHVSGQHCSVASILTRGATAYRNTPCLHKTPCSGWSCIKSLHRERCRPSPFPLGATAGRMGGNLPQDWTQVLSWCRDEFRRCVSPDLPDSAVHLAKCCLLVALEEEAARSGEAPHPELEELMAASSRTLRPRSAASASTWSGERLEALAAEVAALLDQQLDERAQGRTATAAPVEGVESAGKSEPSGSSSSSSSCDAAAAAAAAVVYPGPENSLPSSTSTQASSETATPTSSFDFAAEQEQLLDRIHTSQPGAVGSTSRGSSSSSHSMSAGASSISSSNSSGGNSRSSSGGGGESKERYYGSAWPSVRQAYGRRTALYRRYPVQTLAAVNTVLFDRHGYMPCNRYGVPSDHQLSSVLERGVGASAALSILYLEVCDRLGFPLAARPLEDGRYFVLWPVDAPLTADGQRFLVDPYGRGGLLLLDEVCEIFGVEPASLRPAGRRELLAALLGELRDVYWAAAVGCSPQPGSMTPLSAETALENVVSVPPTGVRAASLRRALAAAEKRLWLLPDDSESQLQYGLLLYFSRRYDDAWIELALYLERFTAATAAVAFSGAAAGPAAAAVAVQGKGAEASSGGGGDSGELYGNSQSLPEETGVQQTPWNVLEEEECFGSVGEGTAAVVEGKSAEDDALHLAMGPPVAATRAAGQAQEGEREGLWPLGVEAGGRAADLTSQVARLVERIRLELDFAPTPGAV